MKTGLFYLIGSISDIKASYVHQSNDTVMLSFDQVANGAIVEVLDRRPCDAFALVLFLFLLENHFNKQLLQLLITVVDAKLFERVAFKDFKAVDVQHADHRVLAVGAGLTQGLD